MNIKIFISSIVLSALMTSPVLAFSNSSQPLNWAIDNGTISVVATSRDGAAISEIWHNGKQFIDAHDHGRQLQMAWSINKQHECWNPTEAGSSSDGTGETSSSQILSVIQEAHKLTTTSHPAFWMQPGQYNQIKQAYCPVNYTKNYTNQVLRKEVSLNALGIANLIQYKYSISFPDSFTSVHVEAPTAYLKGEFSRFYELNLEKNELNALSLISGDFGNGHTYQRQSGIDPMILATQDSKHAMGIIAIDDISQGIVPKYVAYYFPAEKVAKWSVSNSLSDIAAGGPNLNGQVYIAVGSLETVRQSMIAFYQKYYVEKKRKRLADAVRALFNFNTFMELNGSKFKNPPTDARAALIHFYDRSLIGGWTAHPRFSINDIKLANPALASYAIEKFDKDANRFLAKNWYESTCRQDGFLLQSGESKAFFSQQYVNVGESCLAARQVRTCTKSVLSGDSAFKFKSCAVKTNAAPIVQSVQGPSRVLVGQVKTWVINAIDPDGDSLSYSAFLGDKLLASEKSASISFSLPGTFKVEFAVKDPSGAKARIFKTISVMPANCTPTEYLSFRPDVAAHYYYGARPLEHYYNHGKYENMCAPTKL